MSALVGRKVILRRTGSPVGIVVAAGRSKTISVGAEPIDITSDDDLGLRTLLSADAGQKQIDISFEGITKTDEFLADLSNNVFVDNYELEITGIGTITGNFFIVSYSLTGAYNEATTFSAELQSTGDWTYAAVT
jgi:TP901-1 family phage major tail protein